MSAQDLFAGALGGDEFFVLIVAIFDEERRFRARREALDLLGHAGEILAHRDRGRVHDLERRRTRVYELGQDAGGRIERGEHGERGRRERRNRDRAERRFGDERERPLASDHELFEDVDRPLGIEERVDAVAHRVLEREALANDAHTLGVRYDSFAKAREALVDVGRVGAQASVGPVPIARVEGEARR